QTASALRVRHRWDDLVVTRCGPPRGGSLRDVEKSQAHLVLGAFAPVQFARKRAAGLVCRAVVPVALDRDAVARLDALGSLERVGALPVEVPAGDVQKAFARAARALDLEPVARAPQMLVRARAVDGERAGRNGAAGDEPLIRTWGEGERVAHVGLPGGNHHRARVQPRG